MKGEISISGTCPICSYQTTKCYELFDDRYGYPSYFVLATCSFCGHKHLNHRFNPEQLTILYSSYYPRSKFDLNNFKPFSEVTNGFRAWFDGLFRSAFRWVPRSVRVLDIGCGFGQTLGYHQARGCDVYGVEADENIRRVADKFGFKVHVGLFDPNLYQADFFDYVTMDQVLEHVTDPLEILKGIARILKPGGTAIFSIPNANGWGARVFGRKWINWHAPYHLHFFSLKSIKVAAEKAGLQLAKVRTITSSEWLYYQWIHLVTYPNEGQPSGFWSPHGIRTKRYNFLLRMLSKIHKTKVNHLITRFFDALGLGDNYLIFMRKK